MKRVALFLANGFEEMEALGTVDILRRAQIAVETVSVTSEKEVEGAHGMTVIADKTFDEFNASEIDMLVLPGGMPGAKNLNEHTELKELLKQFAANPDKTIAAICAAPMVLGGLGLLDGKKAICYPGFEPELIGAKVTDEKVVEDGNIITGKGPGLVFDFGLHLVETIAGVATRKEVQESLLL